MLNKTGTCDGSTSAAAEGWGWHLMEELARPYVAWVDMNWLTLMETITWSDATIFAVGTYAIHQIIVFTFSSFYCLLHSRGLLLQYRIQTAAPFDKALFRLAAWHSFWRALVKEFPVTLLMYSGFHYFGTEVRAPLPPITRILRDWILCWLWTETAFYWSHRLFHHRWFYKRFHKQHHIFKTSVALNTEYAHPLEHLVSNVLTTFGGPLLLGSHVLVFWSYFAFRLWETFDGHSGYTIPILSPFSVVSWWTGPQMHDFHHSHNIGAFGTMTCFWDWVCGTDKAYRLFAAKEKEKQGRKNNEGIDRVEIKEDDELETKKKMYEGNVWKKAAWVSAQ